MKRYVDECLTGNTGPRGKDFNTRWVASMVAEAHRILMRGGVYLYPRDSKDPSKAGRDDSFMSRANTIVMPGGKMELAMQLIFTPFIGRMIARRQAAMGRL